MIEWLLDLFTLGNLVPFLLGVGSACLWHMVKAQFQHRILIIKWQYIAVPLAVGIAIFMGVQTQQNADCVREFNRVLRERSQIAADNDRLSIYQRELIYDWMHNLVFPPPDIAQLPGTDPVREKWAIDMTIEVDQQFKRSINEQRENDARRAANPLPPPDCGL